MKTTKESIYGTVGFIFSNADNAEKAYNALKLRGYNEDEIGLLMSEATKEHSFSGRVPSETVGNTTAENIAVGSGVGGTLGAIAGAIITLGTTAVIPGLGLVVAGPIIGALTGAGAAGATGALIGALTNIGIPEDYAKTYNREIEAGKIILLVNPRDADETKYFNEQMSLEYPGTVVNHWNA